MKRLCSKGRDDPRGGPVTRMLLAFEYICRTDLLSISQGVYRCGEPGPEPEGLWGVDVERRTRGQFILALPLKGV